MRRVPFLLTLSLLALTLAAPLRATVIIPAEFREIVGGSQLIVHGRVVDVRAAWAAADAVQARRHIETIVTLEASEYLKGGPGRTVTFRVPGGTVGRLRSTMIGAPVFAPGDEVVIFLRASGPAIPQVFGLSQGVFRVRVDGRTGERVVVPPALMAADGAPRVVRRGAADRRPLPLETFGAQVRAALATGAER